MFKVAKLFLALSLISTASAYAFEECRCSNCPCTEESNCGCLDGKGCNCGPDSSCSTPGNECKGGSCKVKTK